MDRSFLSDKELIAISREFVCIRTATYEDKTEAKFLESIFVDRSGSGLRNFGYCILDPAGKNVLRTSSRGPNFVYENSDAMVADLKQVAGQFSAKSTSGKNRPVPQMKNVRLGINVASCDGLPSVVVFGDSDESVARLNSKLEQVIWDEEIAGKFIYASTTKASDLKMISGSKSKNSILVIKPDQYGLKGRVITSIEDSATGQELKKTLQRAADGYVRYSKEHGQHVRNGKRNGQNWETEVPVPQRNRFRGRGQQSGGQRNRRQ